MNIFSPVLIEEYITGTEFTIDGIKTSEGHQCLAISEKKHYDHNENVACQLYFSNENSCAVQKYLSVEIFLNDLFIGTTYGTTFKNFYDDNLLFLQN